MSFPSFLLLNFQTSQMLTNTKPVPNLISATLEIVFLCIWRKEVEFLYVSAEDEQIEGGSAKLSGGRVFTG